MYERLLCCLCNAWTVVRPPKTTLQKDIWKISASLHDGVTRVRSISSLMLNTIFFFFFLPKNCAPAQNFIATPSIFFSSHLVFILLITIFFNFRINHKITNSFQLHSLLFLKLYIIYQIIFFKKFCPWYF